MSRATKALAALAALAATASAAHPAAVPAPANCARHIRLGVFEEAIPYAVTYMVDRRRLTPRMREVFPFIHHAVVQTG